MALLTVLLLVAIMAAVAVAVLEDVRFSIRRTSNVDVQDRSQAYAAAAEAYARVQITRLARASGAGPQPTEWNGRRFSFPIEGGTLTAVLRDGQSCFNLNSVVVGQGEDLMVSDDGVARFMALGRAVGLSAGRMRVMADSLVDWMDADTSARPAGAEDSAYGGLSTPYRTGGVMLAEVSEFRAVRGVDAESYALLRPYLCALPTTRAVPINANTLRVEQAPLLMALGPVSLQAARAAIAARPDAGWRSAEAFWNQPALRDVPVTAREAIGVSTQYFVLTADVQMGDFTAARTALIQASPGGEARTVIWRWTSEE